MSVLKLLVKKEGEKKMRTLEEGVEKQIKAFAISFVEVGLYDTVEEAEEELRKSWESMEE